MLMRSCVPSPEFGGRATRRRRLRMIPVKSVYLRLVLASAVALLLADTAAWSASDKDQSEIEKRITAAATVLNEIMATPDKAIPDKIMNDSKCVAVIPSMVKVAFVVGGNRGKGVATCRTEGGTW